jgi:hypothetical protein
VRDTTDRLFELLVSPQAQARRVGPQQEFAVEFRQALEETIFLIQPDGAEVEVMGTESVEGAQVDLGIRTAFRNKEAFWHPLSLHAKNQPNAQVAKAKATVLDIRTIRDHFRQYAAALQFVAVQSPEKDPPKYVRDAMAWLRQGADDVLLIPESDSIPTVLEPRLREIA